MKNPDRIRKVLSATRRKKIAAPAAVLIAEQKIQRPRVVDYQVSLRPTSQRLA